MLGMLGCISQSCCEAKAGEASTQESRELSVAPVDPVQCSLKTEVNPQQLQSNAVSHDSAEEDATGVLPSAEVASDQMGNQHELNLASGSQRENSQSTIGESQSDSRIMATPQSALDRMITNLTEMSTGPKNASRSHCYFVLGHFALMFLLIPLLVGLQAILGLIGRRGADFVATFQVVLQIVSFVMSCFSALNVGVFPQVAAASANKDYTRVGSILRVSLVACIFCGVVGAFVIALLRLELFELFSKESERATMIHLGESTLLLMAVGFLPSLLQNLFTSLYQGLGLMPHLMANGFLQLGVSVAFIVIMYDEFGLVAFGWSNIFGACLSCLFLAGYILIFSKSRHLYRFCYWSGADFGTFREILRVLGWVSVRSVFSQLRTLVMVALLTRMGALYGAVYPVLNIRLAYAFGPPTLISFFFIPFLCSRLWGCNMKMLALQLMTDYFKLGLFLSFLAFLYLAYSGKRGLELEVENVLEEAEEAETELITWEVYILFLVQCVVRSLAFLYDGACIALEQVRETGLAVVAGCVVFMVIALIFKDSFAVIYFAEVMFFTVRAVITHWCLLRHGWSPLKNFPAGLTLEPEWEEALKQAMTKPWYQLPLRRVYLGYVTTNLAATFLAAKQSEIGKQEATF